MVLAFTVCSMPTSIYSGLRKQCLATDTKNAYIGLGYDLLACADFVLYPGVSSTNDKSQSLRKDLKVEN